MNDYFANREVVRGRGKRNRMTPEPPQVRFFSGQVGRRKEPEPEPEEHCAVHSADDGMQVEAVLVDGRVERIIVQCGCGKQTVLQCRYDDDQE